LERHPARDIRRVRELPGGVDERRARIDADDVSGAPDAGGDVAEDDPGATAHVEHAVTGVQTHEIEEPSTQSRVRRRSSPQLERLDQLVGIGPGVDVAIRVRVQRAGTALRGSAPPVTHATAQPTAAHIPRCRNTSHRRRR
jgi:hypothetical protein